MQVKGSKSFAKNVSSSLSESLSASTSLSLAFRAEFSLSKASIGPDLVERSVDRLSDSKFIFRSSKSSKSCELDTSEPSVPEAKLTFNGNSDLCRGSDQVSHFSFIRRIFDRKSSSLLPSAYIKLAKRSLSISLLP